MLARGNLKNIQVSGELKYGPQSAAHNVILEILDGLKFTWLSNNDSYFTRSYSAGS